MALHDTSTGLPTLELLEDRLEMTMAQHQRTAKKAVLLLLESRTRIDHEFRRVISQRMQYAVRNTDTVAMLNDSTFAVLLTDLQDSDNAIRVVDALVQRCQQPYQRHGISTRYKPSVGMAVFPDDANDVAEWMRKADKALAEAKAEPTAAYKYYTEDMNVRAHRRQTLSANLRKAWARDELKVYGQPGFDRQNGNWCSVELLLRWEHPEEGQISADQFADIAQLTGLWVASSEKLILTALEGATQYPHIRWTWNAPVAVDFKSMDDTLPMDTFSKFTGPKHQIGLEIPEQLLAERPEVALQWMKLWKDAGGFISLDGFGEYPIPGIVWNSYPIDEVKTILPLDNPYQAAVADAFNWRWIQKHIDSPYVWRDLPVRAFGQGNILHPALPVDKLLASPPILAHK